MSDLVERLREIRTRWENRRDWVDIVGQNYHTDVPVLFEIITELEGERDRINRVVGYPQQHLDALDAMTARAEAAEAERDTATRALTALRAFHHAWVEHEVATATGDPDFAREKRAALIAAHHTALSKTEGKG